ncbi:MAG: NACHT domain-containing protein [Cyanobacteria bacterium P01_F01_bin.150]
MKLSLEGKRLVRYALVDKAWTLEKLAEKSSFSISTVKKFSAGGNVRHTTFSNLCTILEIDWNVASEQEEEDLPINHQNKCNDSFRGQAKSNYLSDDTSIEKIQEMCRQRILNNHSKIQLLGGQKIDVNKIYVDVYLLNMPEHKFDESPDQFIRRFNSSKRRIGQSKNLERVPGFEIANSPHHSKLFILGKPGSGKTTFLKSLAVDWCNGKFQSEKIPIIIELRKVKPENWNLLKLIHDEIEFNEWDDFAKASSQIQNHKEKIKSCRIKHERKIKEIEEGEAEVRKNLNIVNSIQGELESLNLQIKRFNDLLRITKRLSNYIASKSYNLFKLDEKKILKSIDEVNGLDSQSDKESKNIQREKEKGYKELDFLCSKTKTILEKYLVSNSEISYFEGKIIEVEDEIQKNIYELIQARKTTKKNLDLKSKKCEFEKIRIEKEIKNIRLEINSLNEQQKRLLIDLEKYTEILNNLTFQSYLLDGKFLILIDGLDEVWQKKYQFEIRDQIFRISNRYEKNRFLITCRTQVFRSFSDYSVVEVAEFKSSQVNQFIYNWFSLEKETLNWQAAWRKMLAFIDKHPDTEELTKTPVLLSFLCLIVQHQADMPEDKYWLYRKGVNLLLSRWNEERNIKVWEIGNQIYRNLSIKEKENLLIKIAAKFFGRKGNFILFDQDYLIDQITDQLNLSNREDGESILRAIETQHGLLVERADRLWSFSHLTFQEYFGIRWLLSLASQDLIKTVLSDHWQKVIFRLVHSQQPANFLIEKIKKNIDYQILKYPDIQKYMLWLLEKTSYGNANESEKLVQRISYFTFEYTLNRSRILTLSSDNLACFEDYIDFGLLSYFGKDIRDLKVAMDFLTIIDRILDIDFICNKYCYNIHGLQVASSLQKDLECFSYLYSMKELRKLADELPIHREWNSFRAWWQSDKTQWRIRLRKFISDNYDIGYDWSFTDESKEQLKKYFELNKILLSLLKIEGSVDNHVRCEIEQTLFLPWKELHRRLPHIYESISV